MRSIIYLSAISATIMQPALAQLGWSSEQVVATQCNNRPCSLAIGPSGATHVLYFEDNVTGGRGLLRYLRKSPSGNWDAPVDVAGSAFHGTSLAIDPSEVPFVAYSDGPTETERVLRMFGGQFIEVGTPLMGGAFGHGGQGGQVMLGPLGELSLSCFFGPSEDAHYSEWTGSSWSTDVVESAQRVGKGIKAATLSDGRPCLLYDNQDLTRMHYSERDQSGVWEASMFFDGVDALDLDSLPNGDVVVLLQPNNSSGPPLSLYRRTGGTWGQDVGFPGTAYVYAQLSVDHSGGLHAVASDIDGRIDYLSQSATGWNAETVAQGVQGGAQPGIAASTPDQLRIAYTRLSDNVLTVLTRRASTSFCDATDGALVFCPCGNQGSPDSGCDNAQATGGVSLSVLTQSTSPNGAVLLGSGLSAAGAPTAIVIRSNSVDAAGPVAFGDGVRCVSAQSVVRMAAATAVAGISVHNVGHTAMAGPGAFYYQLWYRNTPGSYCTAAPFNLSNGRTLVW